MQDRFNEVRVVPSFDTSHCVYCDGERGSRIGAGTNAGVVLVVGSCAPLRPLNTGRDSYDGFMQKLQEESDLTHHLLSTQLLPKDDP